MYASQIQGCVVEQRVEKKRKIAESVWVHNVVRGTRPALITPPRLEGLCDRSFCHSVICPVSEQCNSRSR